jgi:hypothetical protein
MLPEGISTWTGCPGCTPAASARRKRYHHAPAATHGDEDQHDPDECERDADAC